MSKEVVGKDRNVPGHKTGHYRAYDRKGVLIWEQTDFTVGVDRIPMGVSLCMGAGSIKDGKTLLFKYDPWRLLDAT